jgi:hypothetical protein
LSTMVLLTVGWFAVPQAGPEDANDGFILFTTDRDNPSIRGMCDPPQCEDIYVMAPDGTNPVRLTNGGGAPTDLAAYSSGGADRPAGVRDPTRNHPLILLRAWRPDGHGQPEAEREGCQRPTWRMMAWNAGSDAIVLNAGYWLICPSSTAWSSNARCTAARACALSPSAS